MSGRNVLDYIYDDAGRRTSMTVTGQPTINYTYDNDDRLTQISQGSSTVTIAYDDADQRTSLTLPNGVITEYDYDDAGQVTHLTYKHGANVLGDLSYEYDAAGRRTKMGGSFARSISPQPLSLATYNAANQQITFGANTLSYDLNGNLTSDGQNTYGWDARNQLTSIAGPEVNASFQYDGTGRRQTKSVNGATTSFLYDWSNILQEQSDQSGTANLLAGGLDEIFTRSDATGTSNVIADGLGSWLALSDATGGQLADYSYGAFGQSAHSGNSSSHYYTGREEDLDGLYYYRARYYSPGQHRFLSEDPLGFAGGDVNLYAYVKNNPVNFTDPSGLSIVTKVAKIVKLLAKGGMKIEKKVDFDEAVKVVDGGGDVIATNRRTAGEIAREAGGGKRPVHDKPHGPVKDGYRPHYHPHGRPGGHVFYSIAGILAPNSLEVSGRGCTTNGQFISAVGWDIASGLDPTGVSDIINWAVGLD